MKILYISHLNEESGYGRFCREFLKSIKTTDTNIASYSLKLNKTNDFKDETQSNYFKPDIIIQNILPHFMSKAKQICIGGAILETKNINKNLWNSYLKIMDEVWYPHEKLDLFSNEYTIPTAVDIEQYTQNEVSIEINEVKDHFKFYWIGEISARKNLEDLIKSYFLAFNKRDKVSLIIKAHSPNFNAKQTEYNINQLIAKVAKNMKLHSSIHHYPNIIVISQFWKKEQVQALHKFCDCFVTSSKGESINYPMLDAIGFNNHIISTKTFATSTYQQFGEINVIDSAQMEPCYGQVDTFPWYQTALESWPQFNYYSFIEAMQNIVSKNKPDNNISGLSYENIGKMIKDRLCKVL